MAATTHQIPVYTEPEKFRLDHSSRRQPIIYRHVQVGNCVEKWKSPSYLLSRLEDKPVKIHEVDKEQVDRMDFRSKNFKYMTISMHSLIKKVFEVEEEKNDDKSYYLRWVGDDPRGQTKANFHVDFPKLSEDFSLDQSIFFDPDQFFSSVLRISSPGIRVWTHYDIMDNVYVQIMGSKDVIMWAPSEAFNLYLDGDKSKVVDFSDPTLLNERFPKFNQANKWVGHLEPGDVLFIPALWFHNMKALDTGVAINLFWKNLDPGLYDKNDPYGNRDLLPGAKAMRMLDNVIRQVNMLPPDYRDFYGRQLMSKLESKLLLKDE